MGSAGEHILTNAENVGAALYIAVQNRAAIVTGTHPPTQSRDTLGFEAGREPHSEHDWLMGRSQSSSVLPPCAIAFFDTTRLKSAQPALSTLFAIFEGLTSPATMSPYCLASRLQASCRKSLRRFRALGGCDGCQRLVAMIPRHAPLR